jgi:hypothetical protein
MRLHFVGPRRSGIAGIEIGRMLLMSCQLSTGFDRLNSSPDIEIRPNDGRQYSFEPGFPA